MEWACNQGLAKCVSFPLDWFSDEHRTSVQSVVVVIFRHCYDLTEGSQGDSGAAGLRTSVWEPLTCMV